MTKKDLYNLLGKLNEKLIDYNKSVNIYIYGGACLALAYDLREATMDIDAVYGEKELVNKIVKRIAEEENVSSDWLNDGVKGFISDKFKYKQCDRYSNLKIHFPTTKAMFAMKAISARTDSNKDLPDIIALSKKLNIKDLDTAINIITEYYNVKRIPNKTYYVLEEIYQTEEFKVIYESSTLKVEKIDSKIKIVYRDIVYEIDYNKDIEKMLNFFDKEEDKIKYLEFLRNN